MSDISVSRWVNQRVAMVTGATSGIGRALGNVLADHGARVVLHGRSADRLQAGAGECHESDYVFGDLATSEGCTSVENAIKTYEPDLLILNAAELGRKSLASDLKDEEIVRILTINLVSQMKLARSFASLPRKTNLYRRLVLMLSTSCLYVRTEMSLYIASKAGLMGFGRVLQQEMHQLCLRTTLVFAGRTNTNIRPGNHPEYTSPESVADAVVSLVNTRDDLVPYEFSFRPPIDTQI